ncbi:MAG: putative lipid II flippase FtsW [Verrucomicrobiae bacterium]|jgi:cell division protein FtsW|nr:putative lipid II flippase FtsW [Verrucomicrobiae bacterium]
MKAAVTTLAFCVASLLALGLVMLYSATMTDEVHHQQVGAHYLMMQLVWCGFGFIACVAAVSLNYQWFKRPPVVWGMFLLSVLLLALVYPFPHLPHLPERWIKLTNGAHRWFILPGGVRLQPSELGKLALILALAWYGDRFQRRMQTFIWGIAVPLVIMAVMLGLIFIEPDRGTTILLAAVSGSILLLAGVQWKFIVPPVLLAIAGLVVSILHDPMRMKRIFSWLDLEQTKEGAGYQAYQAMIALGSGGWTGLGLGNGRQKLGFVPEHHTDFIFSIIGEELGLVATLLVALAFVVIACCGLYIALHARDRFGTLLAGGITLLIALQAAINIGVVTSALPNKGLPLPFISYGGSNLMAMLTAVGILLSVARQAAPLKIAASDIVSDDPPNPFAAKAS